MDRGRVGGGLRVPLRQGAQGKRPNRGWMARVRIERPGWQSRDRTDRRSDDRDRPQGLLWRGSLLRWAGLADRHDLLRRRNLDVLRSAMARLSPRRTAPQRIE